MQRTALVRSALALAAVAAAVPAGASAAGKQIVFQSSRVAGGDSELYAVAPDGTGFKRLTTYAGADTDPAVSPNGKKIAWAEYVGGQGMDLFVMRSDGTGKVRVTTTPGIDEADPAWSPDGKVLTYEIRDASGHLQVASIKPSGKGFKQLTHGAGDSRDPAFSPDGTRIAYISTVDGPQDLYVMGKDGSMPQRLTADPNTADTPIFTGDGTSIILAVSHQLVSLNLTTHVMSPMALGLPVTAPSENPSLSPDGTQIAFQTNATDPSGEIAVVKLDGTGLHYPAPNLQNGLLGIDSKPSWG
jgi:Tol biopolymer transport system component